MIKRTCLTHEALQRRGVRIDSRCFFCDEYAETNSHLCLHCKVTAQLWSLFFNLTGIRWTMSKHTTDLLSCWTRRGGSKSQKRWWKAVPSCIWWTVWKKTNGRCFEDRFSSIQKIKESCNANLHFWCKEANTEEAA